jgi:hypothetical protein
LGFGQRSGSATCRQDISFAAFNNYFVILEQWGVITSLLPALPHDYSPGPWTAAAERINVGHKTRFLCQTEPSNPEQAMIPQQANHDERCTQRGKMLKLIT